VRSNLSVNRELKAALKRSAQRAGEQTPAVRGSDWRLATVTAVPGDGLIEVDGDMEVRHLATYAAPAVDDVIVISQSSSGNWIALGPLAD
jgi:hypothetical protein